MPIAPLTLEMAIREVWTQCRFAELSYANINLKSQHGSEALSSSIHSFLSHCAMVSKFLWSTHIAGEGGEPIARILGVSDNSPIKSRSFRDTLEHYDRYLKEWVERRGEGINIMDHCVGPKSAVVGSNIIRVRNYDPTTMDFTLIDQDLDLNRLYQEILKIKDSADQWVRANTRWGA